MKRWSRESRAVTRFLLAAALLMALAPSAQAAIPSGPLTRDAYDVWTIGDSYGSGEGAPDVEGIYNDDGDVISGQFEDWDTRFDGPPSTPGPNQDSTRCHRSGHTSTSAVATTLLRNEFPDVDVRWTSVACGGASIVQTGTLNDPPPNKGGILTPYDGAEKMGKRGIGADKLSPKVYPPQLTQINTAFNGRIDALLMNLGGNDAGFAALIQECLNIAVIGDCHNKAVVNEFVDEKLGVLNNRFDRLALALEGNAQSGDPELEQQPRDVFLTKAPMPLRPGDATSVCNGTPAGNFEANLKAVETQWLIDRVVNPLNNRFATEATQHRWHIVDTHVDRFRGHAICNLAPDNWINQNLQALRKQGELDETEGLPIAVSGGIAHPNRDGYAVIGAALHEEMRDVFVDRYTPDSAPVTTTSANAAGFSVSMNDAALEPLTSGYWHRLRLQRLNDNGTVVNLPNAPDGLRELPYGTNSAAYSLTGRFFVVARACGPLSRNGLRGCSPATAALPVSTFVPARPVDLTADGKAPKGLFFPSPGITVKWKHANALAAHDTRRTIVRLAAGRTVIERIVPGPFTSTRVTGLQDGQTYSITVRACNDGGRCSTALGPASETADQGESPLTQIGLLQEIEIAIEGVPCSNTPVPFDPGFGPGTPGFEDPTPTFQPTCINDPSVGVMRVASRRGGNIDLRWRHPSRWRALRDVTVQFVGRRGVLATLRFDQNRNRLTLSRGSARRSLTAGRAGRLKVGGVTVRLRANAVRGSGPDGADVRMRFAVTVPGTAGIAVGASDDSGREQPVVAAGRVRR